MFSPTHGKEHLGWDNARSKGIYCISTDKYYASSGECAIGEYGIKTPTILSAIGAVARGDKPTYKQKTFRYMTIEEKEIHRNGNTAL